MPQFSTKHRVHHSAQHMFDLVADVERYPEFVPLCDKLHVISRTRAGEQEVITATMTVAYKMLHESFTTRVVLDRQTHEIRVSYVDGPFKHLENIWSFKPLSAQRCEIVFHISYEFRSRLLQSLMGTVFDRAFHQFAGAFEARADKIYGEAKISEANPESALPASCRT